MSPSSWEGVPLPRERYSTAAMVVGMAMRLCIARPIRRWDCPNHPALDHAMSVTIGYETGSKWRFVDSTSYPQSDTVSIYLGIRPDQSLSTEMTVAGK